MLLFFFDDLWCLVCCRLGSEELVGFGSLAALGWGKVGVLGSGVECW